MRTHRELPDSFKFMLAAVVIAVLICALAYGGIALFDVQLGHNEGVVLVIPPLIATLCGIVCIAQLPAAVAALKVDPMLGRGLPALIFGSGCVLACGPALLVVVIAMQGAR